MRAIIIILLLLTVPATAGNERCYAPARGAPVLCQ